ncbi:hypothetical protein GCM10007315_26230 [Gemmobacter tilapiae]|uniref:Uncharacterized protein n=2 Tax=Neogemmobacter tilapiae TaxID=875041 RepID=A0A918TUT9_9RHOB|nr:hypothetical protein GCM10007315_26230 [Gemmobacter tilapiae]
MRVWALGLVAVVWAGGAWAETPPRTDMNACYGETLEVSIVARDKDGIELERTDFSLPQPQGWEAYPVGQTDGLRWLPCQKEPVEVGGIIGTFVEPRLGQVTDMFKVPFGVKMWQLRIDHYNPEYEDEYANRHFEHIATSNPQTIEGFRYQRWQNTPPVGGGWIWPDRYKSPIGDFITAQCTLLCVVSYRLKKHLKIRYDFKLDIYVEVPPFIEIDQAVRGQIQSYMKD